MVGLNLMLSRLWFITRRPKYSASHSFNAQIVYTAKTIKFRKFDHKTKVVNISNLNGILLHKFICQTVNICQNGLDVSQKSEISNVLP